MYAPISHRICFCHLHCLLCVLCRLLLLCFALATVAFVCCACCPCHCSPALCAAPVPCHCLLCMLLQHWTAVTVVCCARCSCHVLSSAALGLRQKSHALLNLFHSHLTKKRPLDQVFLVNQQTLWTARRPGHCCLKILLPTCCPSGHEAAHAQFDFNNSSDSSTDSTSTTNNEHSGSAKGPSVHECFLLFTNALLLFTNALLKKISQEFLTPADPSVIDQLLCPVTM
jgi:hypothetical protein